MCFPKSILDTGEIRGSELLVCEYGKSRSNDVRCTDCIFYEMLSSVEVSKSIAAIDIE